MVKQDKSLLSIIILYYVLLFLCIIQILVTTPLLALWILMSLIWVVMILVSLKTKQIFWAVLGLLPITLSSIKVFNLGGATSDLILFFILGAVTVFGFLKLPKKSALE
jgi:hypothetical protein